MIEQYLPVLIFMFIGIGFGMAPIIAGSILGPKKPSKAKQMPFECGFDPFETARIKFDVRFYLVAILFIIFDLEIAFLFPWGVALKQLDVTAFYAMMVFLALLVVGFIYEWKKGALEWE